MSKSTQILTAASVITEFSTSLNGFSQYEGYEAQEPIPLRAPLFISIPKSTKANKTQHNLSFNFKGFKKGSYGFYQTFIKAENAKQFKKAKIAANGAAVLYRSLAKKNESFIIGHMGKSSTGVTLEIWTILKREVIEINSFVDLPVDGPEFLRSVKNHISAKLRETNLPELSVFLIGDSVLGQLPENYAVNYLGDRYYQLPNQSLLKATNNSRIKSDTSSTIREYALPFITAIGLLAISPAYVFNIDNHYSSLFELQKDKYRHVAKNTKGLDDNGINSSEVTIWQARDTYSNLQSNKRLDSLVLEEILKGLNNAQGKSRYPFTVSVVDYSRELKSPVGSPSYNYRIEINIEKAPGVDEGVLVSNVYKSLGVSLSHLSERFVADKDPVDVGGAYRTTFIGKLMPTVFNKKGEPNV